MDERYFERHASLCSKLEQLTERAVGANVKLRDLAACMQEVLEKLPTLGEGAFLAKDNQPSVTPGEPVLDPLDVQGSVHLVEAMREAALDIADDNPLVERTFTILRCQVCFVLVAPPSLLSSQSCERSCRHFRR